MKTIQKVVFLIGVLILTTNSYAGRWLSPDPIEQMERDPKPTMPSNLSGGESAKPSMIEINSKSLYTYVDNNPVNEVDPLGLWNLWNPATYGVPTGLGTSIWSSLNPIDPSAGWSGFSLETTSEADAAFLDGANPFGNPFANMGLYDPCDKGLQWSKSIGGLQGMRNWHLLEHVLEGVRGPEYGAWKNAAGEWQEGTHFHLDWGNGLGDHHLPQETGNFLRNYWSILGRGE